MSKKLKPESYWKLETRNQRFIRNECILLEFEKIRYIIAEQLNIPENKINKKSTFKNALGADSLDIYQIVSELEDVFNVSLDENEIKKIKTVGDLVDHVNNPRP